MSPVIINILAYIAILTLLAFFGVVAWGALTALQIVNEVKGQTGRIEPPKRAALSIVSTGKGLGQRLAQRGKTIAGSAKRGAASVMTVKDDVVKVYESMDFEGAQASVKQATASVRETGAADAFGFAKQLAETLRQAQAAQKRG